MLASNSMVSVSDASMSSTTKYWMPASWRARKSGDCLLWRCSHREAVPVTGEPSREAVWHVPLHLGGQLSFALGQDQPAGEVRPQDILIPTVGSDAMTLQGRKFRLQRRLAWVRRSTPPHRLADRRRRTARLDGV